MSRNKIGGWTRLWLVTSVLFMAVCMVSDMAGAPSSVGYWVGKLGLCLIAPLLLYVLG